MPDSFSQLSSNYQRAVSHAWLKSIDFKEYGNSNSLISYVAVNGTQAQKLAIVQCYHINCTAFLPDLVKIGSTVEHEFILNWLQVQLQYLSDCFGSNFSGNILQTCLMLFDRYGGLTMLDYLIFFSKASSGDFIGEYQNLSRDGLTLTYLISWLDQYLVYKGDVFRDLDKSRATMTQDQEEYLGPKPTIILEQLENERRRQKLLENQATTLRNSMYEDCIVEIDGKKIPGIKYKLEGYNLLADFILINVVSVRYPTMSDSEKKDLAKTLCNRLVDQWKTENNDQVPFKKYARSRAKMFIQDNKYAFKSDPSEFLMLSLRKLAKKKGFSSFCEALGLSVPKDPAYLSRIIARLVSKSLREAKNKYYQYLEICIKYGNVPIERQHYFIFTARTYTVGLGCNDPLIKYFDL